MNSVTVLFNGYSFLDREHNLQKANCSSTLVEGKNVKIIVDTLTAWDKEILLNELEHHRVKPESIDYVVCSHGHSDHIGNNNLFLHAKQHFVGTSVNHKNIYYEHDFSTPYIINEDIEVVSSPGHTLSCVSLIVKNVGNMSIDNATVAVVGDLFEREDDIDDSNVWVKAGSEDEAAQKQNRLKIAENVNYIIPGHGPIFEVTPEMVLKLRQQAATL